MHISIIKKSFLLAGFECVMDLSKSFDEEMIWIRSELKRSLNRIGDKNKPVRLIGFWQPWQAFAENSDSPPGAKVKYFFGVEVLSIDGVPSDCVVKVIAQSDYAVFREERRGTAPKPDMYAMPGYRPNYDVAGDFEVFDDFDSIGENDACDVLVPIMPVL